jgi:hypothetical protein
MLIHTADVQNGKVVLVWASQRSSFMVPTGFTAIVNKELSLKYDVLVSSAPELIKVLPWGKDFEVDVFRKPDFTALEIVSFATGGSHNETFV